MISYHPNKRDHDKHWKYTWGWRWSKTDDLDVVERVMRTFTCSPIVWSDGKRGRIHFAFSNWIALDFDKGINLEDIINTFSQYRCVIGTTKSHGIPKGNEPAMDRCRVFIQLKDTIRNVKDYEYTVKYYAKKYKSDFAATDAGRKFKPCKETVYLNKTGLMIENLRYLGTQTARKKLFSRDDIPKQIRELLIMGVSDGSSRNGACYRVGAKLTECGFQVEEIVGMIMNSPIPVSRDVEVEKEVRKAVINGSRNSNKGGGYVMKGEV